MMRFLRTLVALVGAVGGFYLGLGLAFENKWPFGVTTLTLAASGAIAGAVLVGGLSRPWSSTVGAVAFGGLAGAVIDSVDADIAFAPIVGLSIVAYLVFADDGSRGPRREHSEPA